MSNEGRYSVIIPTYNYGRYLPQSLGSILGQTHPPAQVIVIDDGSTDETPDVLAPYAAAGRIEYVRQSNMGIAAAQNRGLESAKHDYITFLDADDYWAPQKIERQMAAFRAQPEIDIMYALVEQFISPDAVEPERWRLDESNRRLDGISTATALLRRSAVERIGPFDTTLRRAQYLDWHMRAVALGLHWHVVPEVLAYRRIHGRNTSITMTESLRDFLDVARTQMLRRRRMADDGRRTTDDGRPQTADG
jgi:glycosyltransferase involved in cell wall biosynthesis